MTRPPTRPRPAPSHRLVAVLVAALITLGPPGTPGTPGTSGAPGALQPQPPVGGAPEREGSRPGQGASAVVHTPPGPGASPAVHWRRSRAIGRPYRGRLVGGVELPASGAHFVTVDPVRRTSPNRAWRRVGTDRLVRVLLEVAAGYAAAHPGAPRLVVGDLSRPHGGPFGREFGGDGHRSHQNGLDADVYYPRRDGRERIPRRVGQIDRRLAQDLVDRFVRAGAKFVFVGPRTRLHGPPKVVMNLANHDDHLHVRIRPGRRR